MELYAKCCLGSVHCTGRIRRGVVWRRIRGRCAHALHATFRPDPRNDVIGSVESDRCAVAEPCCSDYWISFVRLELRSSHVGNGEGRARLSCRRLADQQDECPTGLPRRRHRVERYGCGEYVWPDPCGSPCFSTLSTMRHGHRLGFRCPTNRTVQRRTMWNLTWRPFWRTRVAFHHNAAMCGMIIARASMSGQRTAQRRHMRHDHRLALWCPANRTVQLRHMRHGHRLAICCPTHRAIQRQVLR